MRVEQALVILDWVLRVDRQPHDLVVHAPRHLDRELDPLVAAHGANVLALGDNPEGQRLESFDGFPIDQHAGAVG